MYQVKQTIQHSNQGSIERNRGDFINEVQYKTVNQMDERRFNEAIMSLDTDVSKPFNNDSLVNSCEHHTEQHYSGYFGGRGEPIKNQENTQIHPFGIHNIEILKDSPVIQNYERSSCNKENFMFLNIGTKILHAYMPFVKN